MVLVALKTILLMNTEIIFYVACYSRSSTLTPVVDQMWSTSSTQNLTDGLSCI